MADKVKFKQLADELRDEAISRDLQIINNQLKNYDLDAAEKAFGALIQDLKRLNFAKEIADK